MIRYFIFQHIDAIITIIGGAFVMFVGYKAGNREDYSERAKLPKILGPCVIGFGLLRFFMDSVTPVEWRRVSTSDGIASVRFPGVPKVNDLTQTLQGQTVHTVGWVYSVPGKDISLRISSNDTPTAEVDVSTAEQFNFSKQFLTGQGFKLLGEGTAKYGDSPGYYLQLEAGDGKAVMWLQVAYVGNRIYRVVGSAGAPFRDDPIIPQFMQSFLIRTMTANTKEREDGGRQPAPRPESK